MAQTEVKIPAMGEGIIEVTLIKWLVNTGDSVEIEQPLAEIATDKIDSEIYSPVKGIVIKLIYHEGEVPKVGEIIAIIETREGKASHAAESFSQMPLKQSYVSDRETDSEKLKPVPSMIKKETMTGDSGTIISPYIRHIARQRGMKAVELKKIHGSGQGGRITKDDIREYIVTGRLHRLQETVFSEYLPEEDTDEINSDSTPAVDLTDVERIPMDRIRKLIAAHMVRSKRTSPHVTSFAEADVTGIVNWRTKIKDSFFENEHVPFTYTPLFTETVAKVLKEFPGVNASVNEDSILLKKNINIGIATALPDGNLIVPVVKNADSETLKELAKIIHDLVNRARENKLLPAEIKGGTFTITNLGQHKNLTGTPIINQPEAAILALGTITKKPWAVKTSEGFGIAIRDIIMLSLTYDHRIIDGALGGSFLNRIVWYLENFDTQREL